MTAHALAKYAVCMQLLGSLWCLCIMAGCCRVACRWIASPVRLSGHAALHAFVQHICMLPVKNRPMLAETITTVLHSKVRSSSYLQRGRPDHQSRRTVMALPALGQKSEGWGSSGSRPVSPGCCCQNDCYLPGLCRDVPADRVPAQSYWLTLKMQCICRPIDLHACRLARSSEPHTLSDHAAC